MRSKAMLTLLLAAAVPIWAQTASQPDYEGNATTGSVMTAPPPVSGVPYPTEVGAEMQSNYVQGELTVGGGYIRNLYVGGAAGVKDETTLTIQPNISLDEVTPRQHLKLKYAPQFKIYEPTTSLNETDHSLEASYRLHLMPYVIVSATDRFQKAALIYGSQAFSGGVSQSPQPEASGAIPPLAHWTGNTAQAVVNWQYARYAMVGASGTLANMRFSDATQVTGLFDSDSRGGSGFWTRQISRAQYLGAVYQYFDILANPTNVQSETQTHTLYGFYTQYLTDQFSISVSAGPQHFQADQITGQPIHSWSPAVIASLGWQGTHTSFSVSYDRSVTGGGGLLGAYHSYGAHASARWQMSRTWTSSIFGGYSSNRSVFADAPATSPYFNTDGHMVSGSVSIDHRLTEHMVLAAEYDHIHQSYGTITAISSAPNSDRAAVSLTWQFLRPLGR